MTEPTKYHLYFSTQMAEELGTSIYRLDTGENRHITCALSLEKSRDEANKYLENITDKQYLGIGYYISKGNKPPIDLKVKLQNDHDRHTNNY